VSDFEPDGTAAASIGCVILSDGDETDLARSPSDKVKTGKVSPPKKPQLG